MYNRYVPQADGSFRRSSVQEEASSSQAHIIQPEPEPKQDKKIIQPSEESNNNQSKQMKKMPMRSPYPQQAVSREPQSGSIGSFLKGLLPQNFDTEDLIVVLLLLLISGNNSNDQNAALMTLGIYLFL